MTNRIRSVYEFLTGYVKLHELAILLVLGVSFSIFAACGGAGAFVRVSAPVTFEEMPDGMTYNDARDWLAKFRSDANAKIEAGYAKLDEAGEWVAFIDGMGGGFIDAGSVAVGGLNIPFGQTLQTVLTGVGGLAFGRRGVHKEKRASYNKGVQVSRELIEVAQRPKPTGVTDSDAVTDTEAPDEGTA